MADRDADRIAGAERLMEDAVTAGRVELPVLTREELAALGALDAGALREAEETSWWTSLDEEARDAVTVAAVRGLAARGLVGLEPQDGEEGESIHLPTAPELGTVLVARAHPAFVAVGREATGGGRVRAWTYGVGEEERGLRCVLSETTEGAGLHRFALCSVERGLLDLCRWACAPGAAVDEEGRPVPMPRTLEVIRPSESGPVSRRYLVLADRESARADEVRDGDEPFRPQEVTAEDLAARLRDVVERPATSG